MSTYLSQCLKSQRSFCLDKETISAKDMNPKYPDIKLGIFLLNKLQKNADSGFFERKWFNHFFSPHGESKIIYKFLAVLAQLEILQL